MYIGGQNAINSTGELIEAGDLEMQSKQALHNIATILASENASFANLVKLNIYLVHGSDLNWIQSISGGFRYIR
ncbi:RidA family protein [Paenibacillus lautus]|uniref:RidA family protein n=1 Tax=Paenibacillus TaxID=44249 RepID=UPI0009F9C37B